MLSESRLPGYIPDKNVLSMVSMAGSIWVSAGTSLFRLNTSSKTIERITPGKVDIINALLVCDEQTLLLGTNNGLWSCPTASPDELTRMRAAMRRSFSRLCGFTTYTATRGRQSNIIIATRTTL